jgi:hypothetical protein
MSCRHRSSRSRSLRPSRCVVGYEDAEPRQLLENYAAAGAHRLIFFCPGEQGTAPDYGIDGMQRRLDVISKNYLNVS